MTKTSRKSRALPSPEQLEFQDWQFGMFLHFGIRSFYEGHRSWDGKPMSPEAFTPMQLDCNQWMLAAKQAGMTYAVLTAKHHDGFANWPSKYSNFSVAASPWKSGRGDVVREFVDACAAHGIAPGLYYSPAEWGDSQFTDDPKAYDEYFIGQVSELLSNYGEIRMIWLDGCGSEDHEYDWPRIIAEVRRLQPRIMIFGSVDPDYRWVGNEAGLAPPDCRNLVDEVPFSVLTDNKQSISGAGPRWLPAECDCTIRDATWFHCDADAESVKSLEELMGLYYYSVGRGANLLLNLAPDRRGLLGEADTKRLAAMGAEIRRRFDAPLATLGNCVQTHLRWQYAPADSATDAHLRTASEMEADSYDVGPFFLVDHAVIAEDLRTGEHIRRFRVEIEPYPHGSWLTVYEGQAVGHKAICPFPLVRARKVAIEVTEADGPVTLRSLEFHNSARGE